MPTAAENRNPPARAASEIGAGQPVTKEIITDNSMPITIPAIPPVTLSKMSIDYPTRHHDLQVLMGRLSRELPGTLAGFAHLHKDATAAGALSVKFKKLVALGIAVAIRCDNCIAYHVHDALKAGATHVEILETFGVAMMMGGGPRRCMRVRPLRLWSNPNPLLGARKLRAPPKSD
jgi:AhpD family alkylhydroperoxidase